MKKIVVWLLLIISMMFGNLYANSAKAIIVFDASGSMWGQIGHKAKITIAKDALKDVVRDWNSNTQLGLMIYGHRKKGDCNDIEVAVPVGSDNKQAILKRVAAISPKGKTPISKSLKLAANELKYTEDKATIILISDGKETCDTDPCATAKELKKQGIDFVTHVIGFNVDKSTDKQLECIANATGGEYFSAKNAKELNKAIKSVVKKVEKPKPTLKSKKVIKLDHNIEISASESEGSKWVRAYNWIYPVVNGIVDKDSINSCNSFVKKPCEIMLPEGQYVVVTEYNRFKVKSDIVNVVKDKITKVHNITGQTGILQISASESDGGKWVRAYHWIYPVVDGKAEDEEITTCSSFAKKPCELQLPIGKYLIKTDYNRFHVQSGIVEVKTGGVTKVHNITGQTGILQISASESDGGKWVRAYHWIYPVVDGKAEDEEITTCSSFAKKPCELQLPIGKYLIKTDYNQFHVKSKIVELKPNEVTKVHNITGQTSEVKLIAIDGYTNRWRYGFNRIYPIENGEVSDDYIKSCTANKKNACILKLPVGKYLVKTEIDSIVVASKEFTIKPNASITVKIPIYEISLTFVCDNMKPDYELYSNDGQLIQDGKLTCNKNKKIILKEGAYSLEVGINGNKATVDFSVGKQSTKNIKVDLSNIKQETKQEEILKPKIKQTPTKEELIKADTPKDTKKPASTPATSNQQPQLSDEAKKQLEEIQKAAQMMQMLEGMMNGMQPQNATPSKNTTQDDK